MAGEAGPTICARCKHLSLPVPSAREWMWLCRAQPKDLEFSYQTGETTGEPFRKCQHVNQDGNCPWYEEGINELSPDLLVQDGHGKWIRNPTEDGK